jgi:SAM-dependent methyltransferase
MAKANPDLGARRTTYEPASAQEGFIVPLLREKIGAALREFGALQRSGQAALDVGCGEQPLRALLEGMGWVYVSVDVNQNRHGTVDFVAAIDNLLPEPLLSRGPFALIVCTEVLEHVADWDEAFRNLVRLLAPGGRLLLTSPHFYPLHETPFDYWRPTPYAVQYFAARFGLAIVHEEQAGDGFDVVGTALACSRPVPRTAGLVSRLAAFTSDLSRKAAYVLLRSPRVRRYVAVEGVLYLSNIAVLERSVQH